MSSTLRRLLIGVATLVASCVSTPIPVAAQIPLGFVAGAARDTLLTQWQDTARLQVERAYCVTKDSVAADWKQAGYHAVYVLNVMRASTKHADEMGVAAFCPYGMPMLHTHAEFCRVSLWGPEPSTCSLTAPEAFQCQPSIPDILLTLADGADYGVVQCGPRQFRFFFAYEYGWLLEEQHHGDSSQTHRSP